IFYALILSKNSDNIHCNLIINPFDIELCVIGIPFQKNTHNINIKNIQHRIGEKRINELSR
ncbi:hypothetical protein, partial [Staphylococcus haemolyticus]|uniref:hypothetical protein n=1 Tax=Staphylococcus haemolyticus TaxID=1283 RepID=UPI0027E817A0